MANIASLSDFRKKKEEEEKGDPSNTYYAGGNDRRGGGSGVSVIGPDDRAPNNPIDSIFQRASSGPPPNEQHEADGNARTATITMYRDGFVVNDGPFRANDDPENQHFLQDLSRGFVPRQLESEVDGTGPLNVQLVDKREEEYVAPPPPAYVAYSGEGQTLGESKVADGAIAGLDDISDETPVVDESKPTTTLQIRTADGKRIRAKLNLTHTIRHIQALIKAEGSGDSPYILMTGFPPAQLTDFSLSIEAAGLQGAQLTQKYI